MIELQFDMHIKHLGDGYDIFNFFKYLIDDLEPRYYFLLESVDEFSTEPLFSFICLEPNYILKINNGHKTEEILTEHGAQILDDLNSLELRDNGDRLFDDRSDYRIEALDILSQHFPSNTSSFPEIFPRRVMCGGYLGYLGYDIVAPVVGFKSTAKTPDIMMGMHTKVLIYNHKTQALFLIDNSFNKYEPDLELENSIRKFKEKHKYQKFSNLEDTYPEIDFDVDEFPSNIAQSKFSDMIEKTKDYILEGDIFQAVISRKVSVPSYGDDLSIYGALRKLNPSPYMYYLNFEEFRIIGSSPEALVTNDQNTIYTVPIAGTRRRGKTPNDEIRMENELINDPKEIAEHLMLVDLARNDLAKISLPGTVHPTNFMKIRKYRNVMHIVTNLQSKMQHGLTSFDLVKSMFPAGTVSGAPKLRAMEIIQEVEVDNRGAYAGAVGYFSLNGDCDLAITIRSLYLLNKTVTAQAGGGIVADSDPRLEWIETKNKLRSLLTAVKMAEVLQ